MWVCGPENQSLFKRLLSLQIQEGFYLSCPLSFCWNAEPSSPRIWAQLLDELIPSRRGRKPRSSSELSVSTCLRRRRTATPTFKKRFTPDYVMSDGGEPADEMTSETPLISHVWIETRQIWVFMSRFLLRSKASISPVLYFYLHHKVWGGKVSVHHSALGKVNIFCRWKLQTSQIGVCLLFGLVFDARSTNQISWINREKWQKNGPKKVSEKLLNPHLRWTLVKLSVCLL